MTTKSKYYVIKRTPCSACHGLGVEYSNSVFSCDPCHGQGYFTEEVDLALALTEIAAEVEAALVTMAIIRGNDK